MHIFRKKIHTKSNKKFKFCSNYSKYLIKFDLEIIFIKIDFNEKTQ